ncbi:MAG: hypothetical protein QOI01_2978 [Mycobacterium sp.]|jgi:hypothetical protein|nr:hypothetical protein [Mycobacterium sp.]
MSVNELASHVGKPVSQHLAKLRMARLVRAHREGTTSFYSLDNDHIGKLVNDAVFNAEHAGPGIPGHHRDAAELATCTEIRPVGDIVISNFAYAVRAPLKPGQQLTITNNDEPSHSVTPTPTARSTFESIPASVEVGGSSPGVSNGRILPTRTRRPQWRRRTPAGSGRRGPAMRCSWRFPALKAPGS